MHVLYSSTDSLNINVFQIEDIVLHNLHQVILILYVEVILLYDNTHIHPPTYIQLSLPHHNLKQINSQEIAVDS